MSEVLKLHREAMDCAENAFVARLHQDDDAATALTRRAFELESAAAELLQTECSAEPSRSILYRSAASLALECGENDAASRLIMTGLLGNPPGEIADELKDLYEQANFFRHLELKGICLAPTEVQMSVAGDAVGYGFVQSEVIMLRVITAEKLLTRTAERCQHLPFRERGRPSAGALRDSELYLSAPRAASFAVTLRVGRPMSLPFDDLNEPIVNLVDQLMDCLEAYNSGDAAGLQERIPDRAYYNNFVSLARDIAPDGQDVKLVGFTAGTWGKRAARCADAHSASVPRPGRGRRRRGLRGNGNHRRYSAIC